VVVGDDLVDESPDPCRICRGIQPTATDELADVLLDDRDSIHRGHHPRSGRTTLSGWTLTTARVAHQWRSRQLTDFCGQLGQEKSIKSDTRARLTLASQGDGEQRVARRERRRG